MESAYVGIGSNLGDKIANCREAIARMGRLKRCKVRLQSSFYRTEPVGVLEQDFFVNGVVRLDTDLSALTLLKRLLGIEAAMGRVRRKKWDARVIDLDVLLFGGHIIESPELTVPHPLMHTRRFVLTPLAQIAPDVVHPVLLMSMRELMESLPVEGQAVEICEGPEC